MIFLKIMFSLLKYVGCIVVVFLSITAVIIFLIEMIKLIISRMKIFIVLFRNDSRENNIPLYLLSVIISVVVFYLTYKLFLCRFICLEDYISLVNATEDKNENSIKYLMEHIMDNTIAPDPKSESFDDDYNKWRNDWETKLNTLENVIQQLPKF